MSNTDKITAQKVDAGRKGNNPFKKTMLKIMVLFGVLIILFIGVNAYSIKKTYTAFPKALDTLLLENLSLPFVGYDYGESAMKKAMENDSLSRMESLVTQGVDINGLYAKQETLLTYGLKENDNQLVVFLLGQEADASRSNSAGETPIEIAYDGNNEDALKLLEGKIDSLPKGFVKKNLLGVWKSSDNSFIKLTEEEGNILARRLSDGAETRINFNELTIINHHEIYYSKVGYAKSTDTELVEVQSMIAEEESQSKEAIVETDSMTDKESQSEEAIIETDSMTDDESDTQAEVDAMLDDREKADTAELKRRVAFLEKLTGYWEAKGVPQERWYSYLIMDPQKDQVDWDLIFSPRPDSRSTDSFLLMDRENVRLANGKLEYIEKSRTATQEDLKFVFTYVNPNEIKLNLKVDTDSYGENIYKTITYTKIEKENISSEFLESRPDAYSSY